MQDISNAYAVSPQRRSADPWPAYNWPALERATAAYVLARKWAWTKPREHPAHIFYTACQVPGKNYCRLATIPYEVDLRQSPIYRRVPKLPIHTPDPRGRLLQFAHRQLDNLIAWRQGWRKADMRLRSTGRTHPIF